MKKLFIVLALAYNFATYAVTNPESYTEYKSLVTHVESEYNVKCGEAKAPFFSGSGGGDLLKIREKYVTSCHFNNGSSDKVQIATNLVEINKGEGKLKVSSLEIKF
ncbi:MAG: hypothetical protein QE271_09835 [Bacteriovoracaceae bacterium]|nr:hypothetical protein [Bacteriovoracaceae bacterium]